MTMFLCNFTKKKMATDDNILTLRTTVLFKTVTTVIIKIQNKKSHLSIEKGGGNGNF